MLLTVEQVVAFRKLNKALRRLKIIGVLEFTVMSSPLTEFGRPCRYRVRVTNYDPSSYTAEEDIIEMQETELFKALCRSI